MPCSTPDREMFASLGTLSEGRRAKLGQCADASPSRRRRLGEQKPPRTPSVNSVDLGTIAGVNSRRKSPSAHIRTVGSRLLRSKSSNEADHGFESSRWCAGRYSAVMAAYFSVMATPAALFLALLCRDVGRSTLVQRALSRRDESPADTAHPLDRIDPLLLLLLEASAKQSCLWRP